ncbi:GNAT family N-acetyltransferase [Desulfosporosinus nitroreducens]|uniref:GNAT family N-acetyltransferase n=1 Tax=Desulfosporosinus nitroreducens TaxID=2018668 RepID=A0ABT8QVW2_9FIRM|nr:GNAT family N-acetyltransferase [Desulfosporosinus nitroreducens]MCO1603587.1 GNAT family N-acetyltransferase [Desulfosporosinus nitroreducens]MDO0825492.1 GNAT family N-acetyltransferase [Desulfosporosinus nitroreducens]
MASNYIIRRAVHSDVNCLIGLLEILFSIESDFTVEEFKQRSGLEMMLNDDTRRCIMVAEINQQVVGMCTAQILVSTAEGGFVAVIEDLVVHKEYRGKGIGRGLLLSIESWAIAKGVKRLQLLADRNNTVALEFYKSLSWKSTQLICLHKK